MNKFLKNISLFFFGLSISLAYSQTIIVVAPVQPSPLIAAPTAAWTSNTAFTLSWSSVSASSYQVYQNGIQLGGSLTTTSYLVAGPLALGPTYSYYVTAFFSDGSTSTSGTLQVQTISAPQPLTIANVLSTSLALSWSAPSSCGTGLSCTGFRVFVNGLQTATIGNVYSYSVTGLSAGASYSFTVCAVNTYGNGPMAYLAAATLGVPTGLSVAAVLSNSVQLSWTAPLSNGTGMALMGYIIYSGGTTVRMNTTASSSEVLRNLSPNTTYSITVAAINSAGEGSQSAAVTFTTQGVPSNIRIIATRSDGFDLRWDAPPGTTGNPIYKVYKTNAAGLKESMLAMCFSLPCKLSGLAAGSQFWIGVLVSTSFGEGSMSSIVNVTTLGVPTNVALVSVVSTSALLNWTEPAAGSFGILQGYNVYDAQSGAKLVTCPNTTCSVFGLSPGITYELAVTVSNQWSESFLSSSLFVTTLGIPLVSIASISSESFVLAWGPVAQPTGETTALSYKIYNGASVVASTSSNSLVVTALNPGQWYTFYVSAVSTHGEGDKSLAVSARTPEAPTSHSSPFQIQCFLSFNPTISLTCLGSNETSTHHYSFGPMFSFSTAPFEHSVHLISCVDAKSGNRYWERVSRCVQPVNGSPSLFLSSIPHQKSRPVFSCQISAQLSTSGSRFLSTQRSCDGLSDEPGILLGFTAPTA